MSTTVVIVPKLKGERRSQLTRGPTLEVMGRRINVPAADGMSARAEVRGLAVTVRSTLPKPVTGVGAEVADHLKLFGQPPPEVVLIDGKMKGLGTAGFAQLVAGFARGGAVLLQRSGQDRYTVLNESAVTLRIRDGEETLEFTPGSAVTGELILISDEK